ncbi:Crp/Fnr family transcriptional regulator [Ferruginibacter sp. SUN002]|uniref:Crp/Fnr family transcriptional regulator n=1 Tax=Ferruginibacter sp. SUN002 TaxID=2937789 RepID=UPI003D36D3EA
MTRSSNFTEKLLNAFEQIGVKKTIQKGDFLTKEGEIERNIYLIETGAVRVFYLSEHEEQTIRLGYEHSLINSLSSFIKEQPSEFYIEAIRKTTLKFISKDKLLEIANENEESLKQYIQLLETLITQQIDREIDLLITSPVERLKRVLDRSPNLFQHIPLKYIASYLRMKPETLSRIRNS